MCSLSNAGILAQEDKKYLTAEIAENDYLTPSPCSLRPLW